MRFISVAIIFFVQGVYSFSAPHAPPLIGFSINNGEKFTNNPEIQIRLRSLKNVPDLLKAMQVSVREDFADSEWIPFTSEPITLKLPPGDGEKFIYARLKDKADNVSPVESASIMLDTTPPQEMDFAINKGARFTNDKTGRVFLQIKGSDAVSWQVNNSPGFSNTHAWEALDNNKTWNLDLRSGDGEKFVYARFKDNAGNISDVYSKSIVLDTEPPKNGQITINEGEKYTKSTKVKLKVKVDGAYLVRINDRTGGENFDYTPEKDGYMTINWQFDSLQGHKFVKAFFMDSATNKTTAPAEAEIIYDNKGPSLPKIVINNGNKFTNSADGKVDVQIFLRENEANLKILVSNSPDFSNPVRENFSPVLKNFSIPAQEDGLKNIYLKLIDEAGNESDIANTSIILDRIPPPIHKFTINEGKELVIEPKVQIAIEAEDAAFMQVSNNPNFSSATKWEIFKPTIPEWRIIPGDGKKTVYARFKDEAGNITEVFSASVVLDTQPPVGKFVINGDQKFTNHTEGKVNLNIAFEGGDVVGMQISNTPDFTNAKLIPISTEVKDWVLEPTDGMKTVFLRLKDKAGNYSQVYASKIVLDRNPPENCEIKINNGEEWITNASKKVALSLTATEAYKMKVSNSPDFSSAEWMPYKTSIGWTLEGNEGTHTVYAIFADPAENTSNPVSASIKSDFTPPVVNNFSVAGNKLFCNDPQKKVVLNMHVEGATAMAIDNLPITESSTWEPVKKEKDWILSNEDGPKTVYARFKDQAGNVTSEQTVRIMLDRVPPFENEIFINKNDEWLTDKGGKVTLFVRSNGASEMMLSSSSSFSNSKWEPFTAIREGWEVDIKQRQIHVYAKFRDEAGNISEAVSDDIKIDVTPPGNPKIVINNGDKYLTNSERKMTIGISVEGAKFMRISTDKTFKGADWEPVGGIKEIVLLEGDGVKTVYAQFKDQAENLSEIVSDDIILDTTPPKLTSFLIDDGSEWTNSKEKKVALKIDASEAAEIRIDHDPAFSNSNWQKYNGSISDFTLPGEDGEKILFLILKDEAGNISATHSAKINLKRGF